MQQTKSKSQTTKNSRRSKRFSPYRWSPEICRQIKPINKSLDNWHGPLMAVEDYLIIIATILASVWLWKHSIMPLSLASYLLANLIIGARIRGLRLLLHSASHSSLAKNKHWNYLLGTLFSGWLTLESLSGYNHTHNSLSEGHHLNLGTEGDEDHKSVVSQGLYDPSKGGKQVIIHLLTLPLQTTKYLRFMVKNRILNANESKQERCLRITFYLLSISILWYCGWGHILLLYWIIPLLTTATYIGLFIQIAEHYPLIEKATTPNQIYVSRNRDFNPVLNVLFNTHNEGYHLVHHLFPTLPFWKVKEAHHILMCDEVYASVNQDLSFKAVISSLTS